MCPVCDKYCPFMRLSDSCVYAKVSLNRQNCGRREFNISFLWNTGQLYSSIISHVWTSNYAVPWEHQHLAFQCKYPFECGVSKRCVSRHHHKTLHHGLVQGAQMLELREDQFVFLLLLEWFVFITDYMLSNDTDLSWCKLCEHQCDLCCFLLCNPVNFIFTHDLSQRLGSNRLHLFTFYKIGHRRILA